VNDEYSSSKIIQKRLGDVLEINLEDFQGIFSVSIMKFSVNQMIQKIEKQSELNKELPMVIKLAAYKRNLLLTGLGNEQSQSKEMG
jgi:hypothetical protein